MGLANCPQCGKLYLENPLKLCQDCIRLLDEAEEKVAAYLRNKDRASIEEIHQATGVKHDVILKMMRKGRITGNVSLEYPCESCGKPITENRWCEPCERRLKKELEGEGWKPPERPESKRESQRMYTFNKDR